MDLGITHQSAVDAWECDQMEHLNIRFYGARFEEAEAHAFAALGLPSRPSSHDELQFAREIRCGAAVRIETTQLAPLRFVHRLFDGERDSPSATLDATYESHSASDIAFDGGDWAVCGRRVIRPSDCDAHGVSREAILRLVNHAGGHLGLDRHRQRGADGRLLAGSATVACRILRRQYAGPGKLIAVESRFGDRGRTSLRLQHRLVDSTTAASIADAEVTVVFFDMATRRPVPLPEGLHSTTENENGSSPIGKV